MFAKLTGRKRDDPEVGPGAPAADPKLSQISGDDKAPANAQNGLEDTDQLLDDEGRPIPPWTQQVTVRAIFAGMCISVLFCIMVLK